VEEDVEVIKVIEAVEKDLGADGRLLVRKSGTEPLIRVMVEAVSDEICRQQAQRVVKVMEERNHVIKE
ncbi:MAG: phosphoglucosamine mutase, partial [Clostridiales bacterium]|nr:phosphoglucosamine mutase [Clostridiales bacterium]